MNELKVLTVNTFDTLGGAAVAAFRIHQGVSLHGINSIFLVKHKLSDDKTVISIDEFDNSSKLTSLVRWIYNKLNNKLYQLKWSKYPNKKITDFSDLRSVPLHDALKKIEFDILHLHWINGRFIDLKALESVKKPIIWTLHDNWPFTGICHYFYDCENFTKTCGLCPFLNSNDTKDLSYIIWKKKKDIYSFLRLNIVAPSNWMAKAARKSALLSGFPVAVIPNGIDTTLFSPGERKDACQALDLDPDKKYLLFSAMKVFSDKRKGFTELLEAIKLLDETIDHKNLELLVIGSAITNEKIESHIPLRFIGIINSDIDMVMAYRTAQVTIVPSFSENLSNTIMESLSCGTPVTAFNTGGNADLIEHMINGYLAAPASIRDLANGIQWCIANNSANELSIKARQKVMNNFTMEIVAKEYRKLYESIII